MINLGRRKVAGKQTFLMLISYRSVHLNYTIMAELDVQPKKKSHFWLWVIIIFVLGTLLYFFFNKDNTQTSDKIPQDTISNVKT